jgi:Flp pilus assembly protein TadD
MFKRSWKTAFSAMALTAVFAVGVVSQSLGADDKVGQAVGKRLQEAMKLAGEKKLPEAVSKAKEALAQAKTPFENFKANEVLAYIEIKSNDAQGALHAYEAIIDSPYLDPAARAQNTKAMTQLYFQARNYPKTIEFGQRVLRSTPGDVDFIVLVGQAYFLQKDCNSATRYMNQAIEASQAAGRAPKENFYLIKYQCASDAKNVAGQVEALQSLVARFPSKQYWSSLLTLSNREQPDKVTQHFYRLKFETDTLDSVQEFVEMAQLSLQFGYPGEAQAVLERGFSSKVLEKDPAVAERNRRLLESAKKDADNDRKTLPLQDKEDAKQKTGEADVKLGYAYLTYGDSASAITALERGIGKGGVKSPAESQIFLGMAYLKAKRTEDAKKAFRSVKDDQLFGQVAKLWLIRADQT